MSEIKVKDVVIGIDNGYSLKNRCFWIIIMSEVKRLLSGKGG